MILEAQLCIRNKSGSNNNLGRFSMEVAEELFRFCLEFCELTIRISLVPEESLFLHSTRCLKMQQNSNSNACLQGTAWGPAKEI